MPVLSHLHQLFNAEQCQAYIRTLRWQDRPLQCPRCQSHHIGQWGTYQYRPGCKRYWCHGCKRTFNDLTATCSDLITSVARLDYIADLGWDSVRIATPFG
jgi:transposase-like protein